MSDISIEGLGKWERLVQSGGLIVTQYCWKFRVCNRSSSPMDIKIADNPWIEGPNGHPKLFEGIDPGAVDADKSLGHWVNPDNGTNGPITLAPAGTPGACTELCIGYLGKPFATYMDVFIKQKDGTYANTVGDTYTHGWDDVPWRQWPKSLLQGIVSVGSSILSTIVVPFWYPMSVQRHYGKPIAFAIVGIDGIPESAELAGTIPGIGVPVWLEPWNRRGTAAIVLKRNGPTVGNHEVRVRYRALQPHDLGPLSERTYGFTIHGDDAPSTIIGKRSHASYASELNGGPVFARSVDAACAQLAELIERQTGSKPRPVPQEA